MKYFISGGLLMLSALWGCAFGMEYFTAMPYEFATLITGILVFIVGLSIMAQGTEEM